jgi:uncharacterized protein YndB with AHSA1/START domain
VIDINREVKAIEREVGQGRLGAKDAHVVRLRRTYGAEIDDVWDALTTPERISRWFLPISGDYRIGGHYQFEGNAGGEIRSCDRPNRLLVTWGMPGMGDPSDASTVELRLSAAGTESTVLELIHTAVVPDEMWDRYGPGAVGVGWEGGFLGLGLHLATGETVGNPEAWMVSEEGRSFYRASARAWGEASLAAGADTAAVERNVASTTEFYAPDPSATNGASAAAAAAKSGVE